MSENHLHFHIPAGSRASFDGQKLLVEPVAASNPEAAPLTAEQLKQIAEYLDARKAEATG